MYVCKYRKYIHKARYLCKYIFRIDIYMYSMIDMNESNT